MSRPIVPTYSLVFFLLAGLLGLINSPAVIWDPHSYDGGVHYVHQEQPLPPELSADLLNDCKTYIADGMAAADGYASGLDFYAGCYGALGGKY
jgi:hypothetical protein